MGLPVVRAVGTYEANFDTKFPSFGYGYGYSGYGDETFAGHDTSGQTPSAYSVNTPPAATASFDTTNWVIPDGSTYTYCGWGLGMGFFLPAAKRPTSADLSQYKISFDAKVEGDEFDDGIRTDLQVLFQGPNGNTENYSMGVNGDNLGNFDEVPLLTSTTQSFSITLSDFALLTTDLWDFPTKFAELHQILFQLQPSTSQTEIGLDNDNLLTVDNVKIEGPFAVPADGDFDANVAIDGGDFLAWQRGESPNGAVAGDLALWQAHFGMPITGPGISAAPEPGCLMLAGAAAAGLLSAGRLRAPRR